MIDDYLNLQFPEHDKLFELNFLASKLLRAPLSRLSLMDQVPSLTSCHLRLVGTPTTKKVCHAMSSMCDSQSVKIIHP